MGDELIAAKEAASDRNKPLERIIQDGENKEWYMMKKDEEEAVSETEWLYAGYYEEYDLQPDTLKAGRSSGTR